MIPQLSDLKALKGNLPLIYLSLSALTVCIYDLVKREKNRQRGSENSDVTTSPSTLCYLLSGCR